MQIKLLLLLSLFAPTLAWSQETRQSQFVGTWCSNPCLYGSTRRPGNLPCAFEISDKEIRWYQWDDRNNYNVRTYVLIEQNQDAETLLVPGGNLVAWYAHESVPGAQHRLTLSANHSNEFARNSIELTEESWINEKWQQTGSMYITRKDGGCP
jgi:hypothetical protein